jgi:hypothetical protein
VPNPKTIFDTRVLAMVDWQEHDLIRFVEWRVRAFEVARQEQKAGIPADEPDHPMTELDLTIWLSSIRDKKSLSTIAHEQYPREWKKGTGKRGNQKTISRVRNAISRVEKFLNRDGDGFAYPKSWQKEIDSALRMLLSR